MRGGEGTGWQKGDKEGRRGGRKDADRSSQSLGGGGGEKEGESRNRRGARAERGVVAEILASS